MRRLFPFFVTLLLIACNQDQANHYVLEGNAEGFAEGTKVFLHEIDANNQPQVIDTLTIKEGKFKESYPKTEEAAVRLLKVEGTNSALVFFTENEPLKATLYKDSISASFVVGGKQNELYNEYLSNVRSFNAQKTELGMAYRQAQQEQDGIMVTELRNKNNVVMAQEAAYKKKFLKENSNSLFTIMLLSEMFAKEEISATEASDILANLSPKMASNPAVTKLKRSIAAKKKADIGGKAPAFSAPTPDGTTLSLEDAMGTYTIIDFWASWCRPCRMENPNVVRVYEKYHDKGLNIISVSLDKAGQEERWKKAITDDNMNWYHVSNLKFWQDPIARQYNVRSIPATFLLDKDGKIIDKNLRGKALENKIASLLD